MNRQQHWNHVYTHKAADSVSWYQPRAERSLALLIRALVPDTSRSVIDVGAGASVLADDLLAAGYRDLTLLDLSEHALAAVRERLGESGGSIRWIVGDVTDSQPLPQTYNVWHDRAVFHFLVDPRARDRYRHKLLDSLKPGGVAIIATFDENGPAQCSDLPVQRYTPDALKATFEPALVCEGAARETHVTPAGNRQSFVYGWFRKPVA